MSIISQIQATNLTPNDFDFGFISLKEKVTKLKDDPVAISCALKQWMREGKGFLSLDNEDLVASITDEIRQQADEIREYYTKKFFWKALSDHRSLSDFRRRLLSLLENRITECKDQDCGIYYKLPYFYEEDLVYDDFKKTLNTTNISHLGSSRNNVMTKRLEFLKTSYSWQRKRKIIRYWFKDDNNFLYGIELAGDNPLLEIFNDYLKEHPTVLFQTRIVEDRIDSLHFYKMYSYKFLKEPNA